jgi:predicted aspartyl protease
LKPFLIVLAIIIVPLSMRAEKPEPPLFNLSIFFSQTDSAGTIIIPIKRVKNLIVVEAAIDTVVGNFIIDTGSPLLVLNSTYFRNTYAHDTKLAANATGSAATLMQTTVSSLRIKELFFEKIQADISDLGHIENKRGIKILGLLGVKLFLEYEMIIDQHKGILYLRKPIASAKQNQSALDTVLKTAPILKIPFELNKNIILVNATVGEKVLTFCVDTGAETNALSNTLPTKVLQNFQVARRTVMLGTGGSRTEVLLGSLNELTVGDKKFLNMPAAITRLEMLGEGYGRTLHGILGNPFLVKGIISINFVTKEIALYPYDVKKP